MNWSDYQKAIFRAIGETDKSLIVEAVAGSGKTTTIVEGINHVPRGKGVCFLAFNKAIADTLKSRVTRPGATCTTLHSIGLRAWQAFTGGRVQVEGRKVWGVFRELASWQERKAYGQVPKLVGLAKQVGLVPYDVQVLEGAFVREMPAGGRGLAFLPEAEEGAECLGLVTDTDEAWTELCDSYDVDRDEVSFPLARRVLAESMRRSGEVVDFDDMIFMPIVAGALFPQFDVVFLDETQDINAIQGEIVSRMVRSGGRVIAVGDPNQSIYGFRGADSEAMGKIARRFDCQPLPLSLSYRCPKRVVARAKEWVERIEALVDAPEGLVEAPSSWLISDFKPEDVVLCRLTRPLVQMAFRCIRSRVACRVLGRDIGQGLIALVRKSKLKEGDSIEGFDRWLRGWAERERERLRKKEEWAKIGLMEDRVATLQIFMDDMESHDTLVRLMSEIAALFEDGDGEKLTFATVHKAKGLEWERVFILDAEDYMPVPWAGDLQQERNLMYVAATRARRELRYVRSDSVY